MTEVNASESNKQNPTVELTKALIERPSVTPDDAGCQQLITELLASAGFQAEHLRYGETDNLFISHGNASPLLVLLGHTDVVPPGPLEAWTSPPFQPELRDGLLYGRGAADMKGSVAAMVVAAGQFVHEYPEHQGSLALLITSDEEGLAEDGIKRVMRTFEARGTKIDYCLVGEPSSTAKLGDVVKVGRRGSLTGVLTVNGTQGHVAYPHLAENPLHQALPALAELTAIEWDQGNDFFPATALQIVQISVPNDADNVIPGSLRVQFNLRFNTEHRSEQIKQRIEALFTQHALNYELNWRLSGEPFLTNKGKLVTAVQNGIKAVAGLETELSTAGGTSDGRHVAPTGAEVVELGPINSSIHKVDECVAIDDLQPLTDMYYHIIKELLLA